jgi:hypothetical protein
MKQSSCGEAESTFPQPLMRLECSLLSSSREPTTAPCPKGIFREVARAVGSRSFIVEARVQTRVNPHVNCIGQSATGTGSFSEFFCFLLSISFQCASPCPYISWGMNNRPVCVHSSETVSRNSYDQHQLQAK